MSSAAEKGILLRRMPLWAFTGAVIFFLLVAGGTAAGLRSGFAARQDFEARQGSAAIQEQYNLGVEDMNAGRHEIARQRFEWILLQNPDYPGAQDNMLNAIVALGTTPTPRPTRTPTLPTATPTSTQPGPTPTRDYSEFDDTLALVNERVAASDWTGAIDAIVDLRAFDPLYKSAEVDSLLYLSLRNRGVERIYKESNLGGGSYDLTLAERFGPLDSEANYARTVARLYLYGAGFTGADPEQAIYYFSQLYSMAPYLTDSTGMTSRERYRTALIEYGHLLAGSGLACLAQSNFELAAGIRSDASLQASLQAAIDVCSPPTQPAPEPTATPGP